MMQNGILVVISGFSGAGKGTLIKELLNRHGDSYALSVSATTRQPRPGEEHGKDYFFLSEQEFQDMIQNHELIEYAQYVNHYYGTPRKYVEEQLSAGRNVILEIEIQGAHKVKEHFPDTRLLFVTAPSAAELQNRLLGRGTEARDVIDARLSRAYEESQGIETYDYLVVNDRLSECVELLNRIITNEQKGEPDKNAANRISSKIEFIKKMREELGAFRKENMI